MNKHCLSDFGTPELVSQHKSAGNKTEIYRYQSQTCEFFVREKTVNYGRVNRAYSLKLTEPFKAVFSQFVKQNNLKPLCTTTTKSNTWT